MEISGFGLDNAGAVGGESDEAVLAYCPHCRAGTS